MSDDKGKRGWIAKAIKGDMTVKDALTQAASEIDALLAQK